MQHETDKNNELNITPTDITLEKIINKPYISDNLKNILKKSKILIIPLENLRNLDKPVFPVKTEEIFTYLKNKLTEENQVNVCIEDEDYQEIALHSNLVIIGTFLVLSIALPLFLNIISAYIYDKYIKMNSDTAIKISINVQRGTGESIIIDYEGKADEFIKISQSLPDRINE